MEAPPKVILVGVREELIDVGAGPYPEQPQGPDELVVLVARPKRPEPLGLAHVATGSGDSAHAHILPYRSRALSPDVRVAMLKRAVKKRASIPLLIHPYREQPSPVGEVLLLGQCRGGDIRRGLEKGQLNALDPFFARG